MVKTSEADLQFPVLGISTDDDLWGFPDLHRLTKCGPETLKKNLQADMELIDAAGRLWIVRSVRRIGSVRPLLSILLISWPPQSRIEHELEAKGAMSIEDVRRRIRTTVETHPDYYFDDPREEGELEALLAQVDRASSVAELYQLLGPDTFEPY